LAVFPYRFAFANGHYCHLVAARHALARGNACDSSTDRNLIDRDNDVVFGR
jgi:hypothetical protein